MKITFTKRGFRAYNNLNARKKKWFDIVIIEIAKNPIGLAENTKNTYNGFYLLSVCGITIIYTIRKKQIVVADIL